MNYNTTLFPSHAVSAIRALKIANEHTANGAHVAAATAYNAAAAHLDNAAAQYADRPIAHNAHNAAAAVARTRAAAHLAFESGQYAQSAKLWRDAAAACHTEDARALCHTYANAADAAAVGATILIGLHGAAIDAAQDAAA